MHGTTIKNIEVYVVLYLIVFLVQILLHLAGRWSCNAETCSFVQHKNHTVVSTSLFMFIYGYKKQNIMPSVKLTYMTFDPVLNKAALTICLL